MLTVSVTPISTRVVVSALGLSLSFNKTDLYKHYYAEFQKLAKKFKGQRWFTRNWRISMNFNNSGQPVFTLMKSNWFNDISPF